MRASGRVKPDLLQTLVFLIILLQLCARCSGSTKCYSCDNYFELNMRNLDKASKAEIMKRYCSFTSFLTADSKADCEGVDYDGCVKIVTRSYRYHIDKQGFGLRTPETQISTVVTRDCTDIPPALGPGCHMLYGAGTTTEMCYCKGEYCNSAGRLRFQWGFTSLVLLLGILCAAGRRNYIV